MRRLFSALSLGFLISISACSSGAASGELTPEQINDAWIQAGTPGEAHQRLAPFVGIWKTDMKFWFGPNAKPEVSTGKAKVTWILGGRFLEESFHGQTAGRTFQGRGLTGFDNIRQRYTSMWTDSTSTSMVTSSGTVDESGKVFEYHGVFLDPATKAEKKTRSISRLVSNNRHVFEMFETLPNGSEFKSLEVVYTRR